MPFDYDCVVQSLLTLPERDRKAQLVEIKRYSPPLYEIIQNKLKNMISETIKRKGPSYGN